MESVFQLNNSIQSESYCYEKYPYIQDIAKSVICGYGYSYEEAIFMNATIANGIATVRFLIGNNMSIFLSIELLSFQLIDRSIVSHDNYSY